MQRQSALIPFCKSDDMYTLRFPRWALFAISWTVLSVFFWCHAVHAEPGVTDNTVTFGMSVPLTGPESAAGTALREGAETYLHYVNDNGGVAGRRVRLLALDDANDPSRAVNNAKSLLTEGSVLALMSCYGSRSAEAVLPLLGASETPLIGVASGAESLRQPLHRYLFNLRAGDQDEADAMMFQLDTEGLARIALFYQHDGSGISRLAGVKRSMAKLAQRPAVVVSTDPDASGIAKAASDIAASHVQAVIIITSARIAVEFMQQMQKIGAYPQLMALLAQSEIDALKQFGGKGRGLGVTQVMPDLGNTGLPATKLYLSLLKQYGHSVGSSYGLEGFLTAKLSIEALRRTGRSPTRQKLVLALENEYDLDGYRLNFSPDNHNGSHYVEMTVVGPDGKLLR